jgi:hypothetical protein
LDTALVVIGVLAVPAVILARWLRRRSALRAFADRRGLRFRGTIPSDKYPPYIFFPAVSRAVLLHFVMEGAWNQQEVCLFDYPRRGGTRTGLIVRLAANQSLSDASVREHNSGSWSETRAEHAFVSARRLAPDDLAPFMDSVVALIRTA